MVREKWYILVVKLGCRRGFCLKIKMRIMFYNVKDYKWLGSIILEELLSGVGEKMFYLFFIVCIRIIRSLE